MKFERSYYYYLVAFIDVLGQREAFKGIDVFPADEDNETRERFIEAHEQTVFFIDSFRDRFKEIFETYADEGESELKVPESKKSKFNEIRKVELKYKFFSDSILAYVPIKTEKYYSKIINGIFGVFGACGGMLLFSLAMEKAFRAGIEIGIGAELSNEEVYGPALFKAYDLESKIAQYPRIVIGDEVLNFLVGLSQRKLEISDKDDEQFCKNMADSCIEMIIKDVDGHPILDYLGPEFRRKYFRHTGDDTFNSFESAFPMAYEFVEKEYKKRKAAKDNKLAVRYYLLYNYFKARAPKIE